MPSEFGSSPYFTVTLPANSYPVAGGFVPNTASGNLTMQQLGPATTDSNGYTSAPVATYVADGSDQALGTSTDAAGHASVIGQLKSLVAGITVTTLPANASVNLNQVGGSAIATAATGIIKVGLTDGSGNVITSTSNAIDVNIKSGGGSGFSVTDEASWTAGTSALVPTGGVFNDSAAALTSGQEGTARLTNNRALHVNLRDASANQLLGSKTSANSLPVVIASDQGAVAIGVASGTALAADQTNTILRTSLYVKKSAAADTDLALGSATSANSLPVVIASDQGAVAVSGTFWQTTQPVSGTVTANQGGSNWSQNVAQIGGTNVVTGGASGLLAVAGPVASGAANADNPLKVGGVFNTTQPTVTNGQVVDAQATARGALLVATGVDAFAVNASQTGTWTVQPGNTANTTPWLATINQGGNSATVTASNALKVDGSAVTQPVSGTVSITANSAVNIAQVAGGTTSNAGQTGALQVGGAVATNTAVSSATNPLLIAGSDYGGTPHVQSLKVDSSGNAQVAVTNTPTVTANAGTNLNTSALALESGGNLATLAGGVTSSKYQANIAQIGGATPQMDNTHELGVSLYGKHTSAGDTAVTVDASGNVGVNVIGALPAGSATIGAVTQASGPWTSNITQFGGNNVTTGTGAGGSGIPRVTVSNDSELQLWDGTNGPVAVKAARTAPLLADLAMVHAISPNNTGLPVNLPVIVQSHAAKSSGSVASLAQAFTSNNVQGNSIVVVCGVGNGTAPTISDTLNNTYTQAAQVANGTALNVAVFLAVNVAAGANTVTVNNGGTTASIALELYEVSGLLASVPNQPDLSATNTGSSGTASTGTISAASPNELAFAAVGVGTAAQTITVGSGWTNDSGQQNPTTPAGLFSFVSMSQALDSLKAVTPQATFTSEPWAIAVASFRPVILGVEGSVKVTDGTVNFTAGSKTSANSFPVVIASDQANVATNVAQFGGSNVATGTGASGSGVPRVTVSNDSTVGSNSATGSAVPANAFYLGGDAATSLPTAASGGNLTGLMVDKFGRLVVLPGAMRDLVASTTTTISSGSETTIVSATASTFHDLTAVVISNTSATATRVDFRDTTAGSVIFAVYMPAGDTRGVVFQTPQPQTTVNTNWTCQLSSAVTDIRVFAQYLSNK